uniref:Solute carrier family 15 member 2 n=1 Tax=Anabas testudineus TaxID=64144 RepID=A0A7N5ZSP3_ANATE
MHLTPSSLDLWLGVDARFGSVRFLCAAALRLHMIDKICGTNYPTSICFIVVNEFCERFSYYGMKAVLTLYFVSYLGWDPDLSTAVYHAFSGLCYFTPILGALIADSWLGKFKTIIYLSVVYVIGHVVKSVGAIPTVGNKEMHIALSMLGLILIAFGTGGIKPCVAAFGGDQFDEENVSERQKFFSIFYMSINAGSLLSTVITPILRGECSQSSAHPVLTLHPSCVVVFIAGCGLYKRNPPQGNILLEVCRCIGFAIKNRWKSSKYDPKRKHWLDWAEEKYSKRLIQEIKMVLRVLVLYIPLPMFWALFDQQGSRWTLQARRMNFKQHTGLKITKYVKSVDFYQLWVYRPLRKMVTGMIFAALAFGAATLVEVQVVKTVVEPAPAGNCLLQVFNLADGDISVKTPGNNLFPEPIGYLQDPPKYETLPLEGSSKEVKIQVTFKGSTSECTQMFIEETAYSLFFYSTTAEDTITKDENGSPLLRFFNTQPEAINLTVGQESFHVPGDYSVSPNQTVPRSEYPDVSCISQSEECSDLNLGLLDFGASYTVILTNESDTIVPHKMEDVQANNVHIAWQIPQYVLLTAGEVMFSITGLEFSYSQAPANMKSVLQAGWLLTVAFGNVIVLIVAEGAGLEQWKEFALFAGLLLGVSIIFSFMAYFYTYVDPDQLDKIYQKDSGKEEDDKKQKTDDIQMNNKGKETRM